MSTDHKRFRFSATCRTDDAAVLHCLRAICQFAEKGVKPQIGWGGTGEREWRSRGGRFIVRFSSSEYRNAFLEEGNRLLAGRWTLLATSDDDPATPQR